MKNVWSNICWWCFFRNRKTCKVKVNPPWHHDWEGLPKQVLVGHLTKLPFGNPTNGTWKSYMNEIMNIFHGNTVYRIHKNKLRYVPKYVRYSTQTWVWVDCDKIWQTIWFHKINRITYVPFLVAILSHQAWILKYQIHTGHGQDFNVHLPSGNLT